jgi:predicted adenylyl cyclase CyaB
MESGLITSSQPSNLLVGPFAEEETSAILELIFKTIDVPFRKSEPVPKTILIDKFGTQNSGKTTITAKIEQVFRRHKFNAFCPPETAEIEEVRNKLKDNPVIEQSKHLIGVRDYVLNLAHHPRAHVAIISRGPIDMLYWYERGLRKGEFSPTLVESIRHSIYEEILRYDLVDAFFFFTCSVEAAMKREYDGALTQRRGSKMNEKDVAETLDIYNSVLRGVHENVPGLPIFHVDTSDMDVRQVGEEVLKYLLPTICAKFNVPVSRIMPFAPSLIRRHAEQSPHFEEQVKFIGHPTDGFGLGCCYGWDFVAEYWQEDTYLNPKGGEESIDPFGEVMRIRKDGNRLAFLYKGDQKDSLLSHRFPYSFQIDEIEAQKILDTYKTVLTLRKKRRCFKLETAGRHFTLHLDEIEGLGKFTELRARGSSGETNTKMLLELAGKLGFPLTAIVEGNYLSLALSRQTP